MSDIVIGIFNNRDSAENAISELNSQGFSSQEMSVVLKDSKTATDIEQHTGASVAQGATEGAMTGGVVGGIAGLLIGIGAIAIPGIGGLLIAGPLAAALGLTGAAATTVSGAATGAVAGGLLGGLVGLGIPKEEAVIYEEEIKAGGILLAVPSHGDSQMIMDLLKEKGATQIRSLAMNHN